MRAGVLRGVLEVLAQALHRPLRRYRRRWKIERLFAWFQNFRRLVVRYERYAENFLARFMRWLLLSQIQF